MSRKIILLVILAGMLVLACGTTSTVVQTTAPGAPPTPTQTPCMDVILNSTTVQATYQGIDPLSSDDVFLVADVSFQDNCSTRQTLSPSWDLKDAIGNHFSPVDPPQPIVLDPGESNQQTTAFEVPGAEGCKFTLNLIGVGITQSWTLNCGS